MGLNLSNPWSKIPPEKIPSSTKVDERFWNYFQEGDSILEAGCGQGRFIYSCAINGLRIVGIDINKEAVKLLNEDAWLFGAEVYHGNILTTKFKEKFKGVLLQAIISSLKPRDRIKCLSNVKSAMEKGGYLHIAEFEMNDKYEERYKKDYKLTGEYGTLSIKDKESGKELCRSHNFFKEEMIELIENSGFEIVSFKKALFTSYHGEKKPGMMIIAKN